MAHILLIEDDNRLSKLIAKGLQEAEFEVSIAYDGAAGLKLATQKILIWWLPILYCLRKTDWISVRKLKI